MKLITKELERKIPRFYTDENTPIENKKIYAHYMCIMTNFDWFVYEYDPEQKLFFGFANLNNEEFAELGYFSLTEFEEINKKQGFNMVERDLYFKQGTTSDVAERYPVLKKLLD